MRAFVSKRARIVGFAAAVSSDCIFSKASLRRNKSASCCCDDSASTPSAAVFMVNFLVNLRCKASTSASSITSQSYPSNCNRESEPKSRSSAAPIVIARSSFCAYCCANLTRVLVDKRAERRVRWAAAAMMIVAA